MNKVIVITACESDFSRVLQSVDRAEVHVISPEQVAKTDLRPYDAVCILGGVSEEPLCLDIKAWAKLERAMRQGKRFFIEYCRNFGEAGDFRPTPTRERRLVYLGDPLGRTETYDLLDDQCNQMLGVQYTVPESKPILVSSHFVNAHYRAGYDPSYWKAIDKWALWEFMPNIRVCGLRLCNFERARFAPICKWRELIRHLAGWITGVFAPELAFRDVYSVLPAPKAEEFDARLLQTLRDGFRWFEAAGHAHRRGAPRRLGRYVPRHRAGRELRDRKNRARGHVRRAVRRVLSGLSAHWKRR